MPAVMAKGLSAGSHFGKVLFEWRTQPNLTNCLLIQFVALFIGASLKFVTSFRALSCLVLFFDPSVVQWTMDTGFQPMQLPNAVS